LTWYWLTTDTPSELKVFFEGLYEVLMIELQKRAASDKANSGSSLWKCGFKVIID
jgi:hypothetical protein